MNVSKKQELKNYVVNSIVHNAFDPNELLRLINLLPDQPQLNENQQIVLDWLKLQAPTAKPMQVIFWMMNNAAWGKLDELRKPIMHLTDKQQAQVLEEFGKWAQEQEEKQ